MKKLFGLCAGLCLLFCFAMRTHALEASALNAESAVLIDVQTGQVLFDKDMSARRHPASVTKIMTGLLTMENCDPAEVAVVSDTAVDIPYNTSHVALTPGEELPVDSAMYALMLPSANDAANVLAEHVSGTQEAFAQLMTRRAKELGALDTNFTNAHGLDDDNHYTTAYDMAVITMAAIRNADFLGYFGTDRHIIPPTNRQAEERPFTNGQFMLLPDMWVYNPEVIGGKVGYTDEARHTMSSAARRGDRTLVAVVMKCAIDDKFYDTQTLFDFGFDEFVPVQVPDYKLEGMTVPVTDGGEPAGTMTFTAQAPTVLLPKGKSADDIRCEYSLPASVQAGETPAASVKLILDDPPSGVPALLMELPLTGTADPDSVTVGARVGAPSTSPDLGEVWRWLRWPLLVFVVLGGLAVVRHVQFQRRRARRIERRRRLMLERQRLR